MNTDWWPAEAQLIYSHSFSRQQQQEQQEAEEQQHHQHHHQHHHQQQEQEGYQDEGQYRRSHRSSQASHYPPPVTAAASRDHWQRQRTRSQSLAAETPHRGAGRLPVRNARHTAASAADNRYNEPTAPQTTAMILLRSFATTATAGGADDSGGARSSGGGGGAGGGAVVSRGDTLCRRDSLPLSPSQHASSSDTPEDHIATFLVLTGGTPGSGRSALVRQFFSSDYMHGYEDAGGGEGGGGADLLVQVDQWTVRLVFDDPADTADESRWRSMAAQRHCVHAFLLVYSVTDSASFDEARHLLHQLAACDAAAHHVIILAANKSDLVRARQVSTTQGRRLAERFHSKFIECSGGINHRVDELLAGIATQLHVRDAEEATATTGGTAERRSSHSATHHHHHHHRGFFSRLLHRRSRSCQDLFN